MWISSGYFMKNYKTLSDCYYKTFYATKGNIPFYDKRSIALAISTLIFIYSFFVFSCNALKVDLFFSKYIANLISMAVGPQKTAMGLAALMLTCEFIMISVTFFFLKEKSRIIKNKLREKINIKENSSMDSFKQKWLCKTFSCFPHELAYKANFIYKQVEISEQVKRTEAFSISILSNMIYNKESKPRIIGLLIAFISISVALFISKTNDSQIISNIKIEILFDLMNWHSFFIILFISITLIGLFWFFISMYLFAKEFFVTKHDKTRLLVSDMIVLNEISVFTI